MAKRVWYYLVGLLIACLGVAFIIFSDVGVGPVDILNLGLTEKLGLTLGTWNMIVQAVCLLINAMLLKKRPEFESVATFLLWGVMMDFWVEFVFKKIDFTVFPVVMKWGIFLGGVILVGMGVGIYLTANLPRMPYDGTMVAIHQKFKLSLNLSRTMLEGSVAIIGILIAGTDRLGLGTVVIFFLIGPIIQLFNKMTLRLFNRGLSPQG